MAEKLADEQDDWDKLFSGNPLTGGIDTVIPTDLSGEDAIRHADDAIDFEDEDELADEDDLPKEEGAPAEAGAGGFDDLDELEDVPEPEGGLDPNDWMNDLEDDEDINEDSKVISLPDNLYNAAVSEELLGDDKQNDVLALKEAKRKADEEMLRAYYPGFEKDTRLKMHSLFLPTPTSLELPKGAVKDLPVSKVVVGLEADQAVVFRSGANRDKEVRGVVRISERSFEAVARMLSPEERAQVQASGASSQMKLASLVLASAAWDIDGMEAGDSVRLNQLMDKLNAELAVPGKRHLTGINTAFDSDEEDAILEGRLAAVKRRKVPLSLNDSRLLFEEDTQQKRMQLVIPSNETALHARYNISNDAEYDRLKENYQSKVRSTIGNLTIEHSAVALRLQSPFYVVRPTKAQLRSAHRPSFVVRPNTVFYFSKLKQRKKKKDRGKPIQELLATTNDLSLGDSAQCMLFEYSEEFPLVLSLFGMGSKVVNYYRKTSEDDVVRPKLPVGETRVLGVQDRGAFWNFGFVDPGRVVPTLYNQLIRAPVFEHEPSQTDFLLVRSTGGGKPPRLFLRPVTNIFAVGQTLPVQQIPGPHSRKVTQASKNRLRMVVYRLLNKNPYQRLTVRDIAEHFPDQNDMQNRQRLKEFMEYQRTGDDQGFWKVRSGDMIPTEEAIRAMITPEDVALLEAMQVGQQHLEDAGYGKTVDDDADDAAADGQSTEEQLAPWNISKNFILATQGKAMLQLHGEGDPTGRGEGFSFLRTSMKGGFKAMGESVNDKLDKKASGHSYNVAAQQKLYDDEIRRIWDAQERSLTATNTEDMWGDENDESHEPPTSAPAESHTGTPAPSESIRDDDEMSLFSHTSGQVHHQSKVLRITRLVRDEYGVLQRDVQVVRDPNVIRAYVKRRQLQEDAVIAPEDISVTNDEEKNKRSKRILEETLARLQRNKDRRMARAAHRVNAEPGSKKVKTTTRKCATCGAVGHIRTNKACPMYNEVYGGGASGNSSPAP